MKIVNTSEAVNQRIKELDSIKNMMSRGAYSRAMYDIEKYIEKYPDDTFGQFTYGMLLMNISQLEEAKKVFEKIIYNEAKNKYSAMVRLGEIAVKENNLELGKEYFKRAINESPVNEYYALISLVRIYRRQENYEEALNIINQIENNDRFVDVEKAKIYIGQGKIEEARKIVSQITYTKEEKDLKREIFLLKAVLENSNQDSEVFVKDSINNCKDDLYYDTLFQNAKNAFVKKDYETSKIYCEELLNLKKTFFGEVNYMYAKSKENDKEYEEALYHYALAYNSSDIYVYQSAAIEYSSLLIAKGDLEKAKKILLEGILNSKIIKQSTFYKLINICIKQNCYQEADYYLEQLIEKFPEEQETKSYRINKLLVNPKAIADKITELTYTEEQMMSYSEYKAKKHILKHKYLEDESKTKFSEHINVNELFNNIKSKLTKENRLNNSWLDAYVVDYPGVGEGIDKLRVVMIPNTQKIITMFPDDQAEEHILPTDFEENKNYQKTKNRKQDRISNFNKKYNIN